MAVSGSSSTKSRKKSPTPTSKSKSSSRKAVAEEQQPLTNGHVINNVVVHNAEQEENIFMFWPNIIEIGRASCRERVSRRV